jgi:uncharacterized protein
LLFDRVENAVKLLEPLAEANEPTAQLLLGRLYLRGTPQPGRNCERSVQLLTRSAQQAIAEAALQLGEMYRQGNCVARDERTAIAWYRQAAQNGSSEAAGAIGELHFNRGTALDYEQAERWFLKAAALFDPSACYNLGLMYARGIGTSADRIKAYAWLELAVGLAVHATPIMQTALIERDRVRELLTPVQVETASRLADQLFWSLVHHVGISEADL